MTSYRIQNSFLIMGKTVLAAVAVLGIALPITPARAQITELTNKLPLWEPGHSITTSIKDALPVVTTLKGIEDEQPKPIPADWTFPPGYYRSEIRSYCLHAGAYGPSKGDGYLIAPLKGDRASLIRNILLRSQQNPGIAQADVQRLIWGTEDGATWDSFDNEFKLRTAPLLTPSEIAILKVEPKRAEIAGAIKDRLSGLIPGQARKLVDTYAEMRNKITGTTSYEELERIAVKTGKAPWGKDSRKETEPGPWAYVGEGFFMRAFPKDYSTTTLEIYKVAPAIVKRDDKGRIVHFDSDGYIIDTTYDDTPAMQVINGQNTPVWKFKTVTFRHPDGRILTIMDQGYIVVEPDKPALCSANVSLGGDGGLDDGGHFRDGMKAATDPGNLKDQGKWIADNTTRVGAAWNAAINALAGRESKDASPKKFDPTPHTATPANTNQQRLALSAFGK